ncbi:hypothetical protein GOP47_0025684 [Adiantum capillus-veneris]|uniref:Uncharacterized protein n=1 Tax=Adiantum capillus-veneris TaxID=13818 RepID=A0A9D4Z351_ADICA|nr:hypothetical protein GOP47_0025684 [Adiantum capillus-veneris]
MGWVPWWSESRSSGGVFGFTSYATAEEVTHGIDASHLTAIITGATSGIGFESARVLAKRGTRVVMAVRNVGSGSKAKELILEETPTAQVLVLELNLSSLQSVHEFYKSFTALNLPLNILINNAGILGGPFKLSSDGLELQFATNYLGHFLLTKLLLEVMVGTVKDMGVEGRIINVASDAHRFGFAGGFQLEKLDDEKSYHAYLTYAKTKLANILHANELSRRLKLEGANVTVNSANPGIVVTRIIRNYRFLEIVAPFIESLLARLMLKTIPQGAATQCFLALHPCVNGVSGKYFGNCSYSKRTRSASDPKLAQQLWEFSEFMLSLKSF